MIIRNNAAERKGQPAQTTFADESRIIIIVVVCVRSSAPNAENLSNINAADVIKPTEALLIYADSEARLTVPAKDII